MSLPPSKPFWETLGRWGDAPAVVDGGSAQPLSYRDLAAAVDAAARALARPGKRRLVLLGARNDIDSIIALLAALRTEHALFVIDAATPAPAAERLVQAYRPDILVWGDGPAPAPDRWRTPSFLCGRLVQADAKAEETEALHGELGLVLSTSGSTGSPKAVRLSAANLAVNAAQIVEALAIGQDRRAALCLPLAYTYGLSVLTSHLQAGACVVPLRRSVIDPMFWRDCAQGRIDTLPAVNLTVEAMARPQWSERRPPGLKRVSHSGSRLGAEAQAWLQAQAETASLDVFKMYGMTEATARLAVLPPDQFPTHPSSVGLAVPGGAFEIDDQGQIVYRGPNVMMGYAVDREGLAEGDGLRGRLETGDLGVLDAQGRLEIIGRRTRIAKILGLRINLAEVEQYLARQIETAIVSDDLRLIIYHAEAPGEPLAALNGALCAEFRLPPQAFHWRQVDRLPKAASGKILYACLGGPGA